MSAPTLTIVIKPDPNCLTCHGTGKEYTRNGPDDCDKSICVCILSQESKLEAVGK